MGKATLVLNLVFALGLLISTPISHAAESVVPLLMWGGDSSQPSIIYEDPLHLTSSEEFSKIIKKHIGSTPSPMIVFIRENLCLEKLNQHKKDLEILKDFSSFKWIPAVESPLSVIEGLSSYNKSEDEELQSVAPGHLALTVVSDLDGVFDLYKMIEQSSPNLIGVLTGRSCIYSKSDRSKRDVTPTGAPKTDDSTAFIFPGSKPSRVMLYAGTSHVLNISGQITNLNMADMYNSTDKLNGTSDLILDMNFRVEGKESTLKYFFRNTSGYFNLKNIEVIDQGTSKGFLIPNYEIEFPFKFSYHCTPSVIFRRGNVTVTFVNLQVQIDAKEKRFGDVYDCIGFISIPIWAGIFVTSILAMIMIWGITFIMDIHIMDRFDDPKGRTITISAQE